MDLNDSENISRKTYADKLVRENKATKDKLFHFLLVVVGIVLGWILCYYFPLIERHSDFTNILH